jgi:hypothetical protein
MLLDPQTILWRKDAVGPVASDRRTGFGRGERGWITTKVTHYRVELRLSLSPSLKAS